MNRIAWARGMKAAARACGRAAVLCAALSLGVAGVCNAGVIRIQRVTGTVPGGIQAEVAFVNAMNAWAGADVRYGLAGGAGDVWTLTQTLNAGAAPNVFDIAIGHIRQNLPDNVDVTALVGYGSMDVPRYKRVLIDAFQPGGVVGEQLFDMQDILIFPLASPDIPNQGAWILHGLYELFTSVLPPGNGFDHSHGNALAQENNASSLLGGPLSRSDVLGPKWIGPGAIPVLNPFGPLGADEWAAPLDVMTATGPGQVWLKGVGAPGNLQDVLPGGFKFDASNPYSLPSVDGDIVLVDVAFQAVSEPGMPALLGPALLALACVRRVRSGRALRHDHA